MRNRKKRFGGLRFRNGEVLAVRDKKGELKKAETVSAIECANCGDIIEREGGPGYLTLEGNILINEFGVVAGNSDWSFHGVPVIHFCFGSGCLSGYVTTMLSKRTGKVHKGIEDSDLPTRPEISD